MDLKTVKTQLFNSGEVVKWAYFQKKWSISLRNHLALLVNITLNCHVGGFDIACHEAIIRF